MAETHAQGLPVAPLSLPSPRGRARPLSTSASHNATASSPTTVNAIRRESGDHHAAPMRAFSGVSRRRSTLPVTLRSRRPLKLGARERLPLRGLMRSPARRSSGAATSLMWGRAGRSMSSSQARSGLGCTRGGGSVSRIRGIGAGGR